MNMEQNKFDKKTSSKQFPLYYTTSRIKQFLLLISPNHSHISFKRTTVMKTTTQTSLHTEIQITRTQNSVKKNVSYNLCFDMSELT